MGGVSWATANNETGSQVLWAFIWNGKLDTCEREKITGSILLPKNVIDSNEICAILEVSFFPTRR